MKNLKNQDRTPLFDAVVEYGRKRPAFFRIPGHRYERGINQKWRDAVGDRIFAFDLTETSLTDDLHNASGPILEAERLAAELWGSDCAHFLVNGSTCGNEAMIMAAAGEGETVCIPRNAHKSALYGLILSGAKPIYLMPPVEEEWVLHGGITPEMAEDMFRKNPGCKGLMIVSPSYFGLCSDIAGVAEVCHAHGAILMVDEAHGAHCYFSDKLPKGAIEQGADVVVQSIHKVTGSLTQSSIIHIQGKLVDRELLENNLALLQSTSPSYILMTSLDMARHEMAMNGAAMMDRAVDLANEARRAINEIPGASCAGPELAGRAGIVAVDPTRLTVSADEIGVTGFELKNMLWDDYGIDMELANYRNALAIVTYANDEEDLNRLVEAMKDIAKRFAGGKPLPHMTMLTGMPEYVNSPREAYFAEKETVSWAECVGRVAAELIAPYPPGIPVIYPGERMSREIWTFIDDFKKGNGHLHGPSDRSLSTFKVLKG